jgi:hypothetical protein
MGATVNATLRHSTEMSIAELISALLLFGCDVMSVSGFPLTLRPR